MAVDLHIGHVETVIEAGPADSVERERLIAEVIARVRAELARERNEAAMRERDSAVTLRSFGRRY
jgi:hypothetical protein